MTKFALVIILLFISTLCAFSQVELIDYKTNKDTIYVNLDINEPIELSRTNHQFIRIKLAVPPDVPEKKRDIQIISSKSENLDKKQIIVDGRDVILSCLSLPEHFYTIYITNDKKTVFKKRIIIK